MRVHSRAIGWSDLGQPFTMSAYAPRPSTMRPMSEQLERDAMALVAVVGDPLAVAGEPVDDPVAAGDEAVQRHRHEEDQPAPRARALRPR